MDNFVIGNMIWNGALVGVAAFFIRKWMGSVEQTSIDNKEEYKERANTIIESINKLSDHVATANGRTSTLETKVATQIALCQERNSGVRENCRDRWSDSIGQ